MTTRRTSLRSVAGVNFDYLDTTLLRFVCDEVIELSKCPCMQSAFRRDILVLFAAPNLTVLSDVLEVFQNKCCSRRGILNNSLREGVVTIPVETRLSLAQFLEMAFGGFTSFGLQFAPNAEILAINLFPLALAKKLTVRGHSGVIQAEIYPNNILNRRNIRLRNTDDHMQPVFPVARDQVSSSNLVSLIFGAEMRRREGDAHLAACGRESNRLPLPVESIGMNVVSGWTKFTSRAFHGFELRNWIALLLRLFNFLGIGIFMFLLPSEGTRKSFSCFDTGLDKKIADQSRTEYFASTVRLMMQFHPVLFLMLPPIGTDMIEGLGELQKRFMQGMGLFRSRMKLYPYGSIHAESIPYMFTFCQMGRFSSLRAAFFPSLHEYIKR